VPKLPEARIGLGHLLMMREDYDGALGEYELAREGFAEIGGALYDLHAKRYNDTQ